ncbi:uncharacterized protein LOC127797167 [Diospyros lotus]|uniref:uncharacterized protein LOC127797167 n=1 Tax=Diospyros lotus TaxID=55363 RepID=UPI0022561183|nr:uncharacterized protein LOC127797167 [Diospyros lotus]
MWPVQALQSMIGLVKQIWFKRVLDYNALLKTPKVPEIKKRQDNSALEVSSSTKPRLPAVMEVDCSLEVLPASGQAIVSHAPPDGYGKTGNLIPQNTHCVAGNMQYTQFQTTKPSGLRMPSPSLGFFSQPKSRASSSSVQKPSQPSNIPGSCGPNLQRVKVPNYKLDPRLLHARQKMPKIDNNATVDENARISGLSTECSVSCDNSHASHESGKLKLEGNSVKKVELMSQCYPVSSRMMEEKQEVHNVTDGHKVLQECGEHDTADQRYSEGSDSDFQMNVHRLMQSGSSDQFKDSTNDATISHPKTIGSKITVLDNSITSQISQIVCVGTVDITRQKLLKDKKYDYSVACEVISKPHSKYDAVSIGHGLAILHDSSINIADRLNSSSFPSESADQVNEVAAGVDQFTDQLHVEDIKVNSSDGTFLVKDIDNMNNTSEVNNQYLVVEKNTKSRDHPEPQSDCLLVEQTSKLNNGFLLDRLPLGRQSAGLEVSLNVIPEKGDDYGTEINCSKVLVTQFEGGIQDCGVDVHEIVVQPRMEAALSTSVHMVPPVKNKKCNIDTQFSSGLFLQERSDHTAGAVTTFSSMEYSLSRKEEDMRAKGLKNRLLPDESGTEVSSESPDEENNRTMMNGGILFEERRSHDKFCTGDPVNAVGVNFINQGSAGIKLKNHLLENSEQVNKEEAGTHKIPNDLCVGDEKAQSLDGNLFVGNSNNRLNSAVDNQFIMVPDLNGQSGGQSHITSHSIVADHNTKDNHGLHLNNCISFGKCPTSEECQEEKLLANFPVVKEESESKSSRVAIQVPLTVQDSGVHVESASEHGHMEGAHSGSVNSDTLADHGNSAAKIFGNGTVVSYEATSSHSDMPSMMREDQTSGVTIYYKEICLNEESGPLVRIQTSANETKIVELGVDKGRMVDDIEVEISPKNVSCTGELPHKLDSTVCLTEDGDMAVPIKKLEDDGKRSNLIIPVNAVPFSDEWLAAMEAAGEEILAMKRGAVQNSPTDKSVQPEPGPWSPVKRKQNQIGPFDCTKFTNFPPPILD